MTKFIDNLRELGFTTNQARVYFELIELDHAKAGEIIKRTGLHRNLVYTALNELLENKLVSSSQVRGIAIYKALAPTRLLSNLQSKERIAETLIDDLAKRQKPSIQEIVIYEGIDEFRRQILNSYSTVPQGSIIRYLGVSPNWHSIVGPTLEKNLIEIQKRKKFTIQALSNRLTNEQKSYIERTVGLTEFKTNPLISADTSGTEILKDRISIRSFIKPYFIVEVTHKALAKNYQNYFNFLWETKIPKLKK